MLADPELSDKESVFLVTVLELPAAADNKVPEPDKFKVSEPTKFDKDKSEAFAVIDPS